MEIGEFGSSMLSFAQQYRHLYYTLHTARLSCINRTDPTIRRTSTCFVTALSAYRYHILLLHCNTDMRTNTYLSHQLGLLLPAPRHPLSPMGLWICRH